MNKGFTIIELLIVVGITVILAAAASPIYGNLQVSTQLNEVSAQIAQDLRLAHEQSRAGVNGAAHGVKFEQSRYTVFQGSSYFSRSSAYDRVNVFSDSLTIVTNFLNDEVVFPPGIGSPNASGTIIITHAAKGSRTITLNSVGSVTE